MDRYSPILRSLVLVFLLLAINGDVTLAADKPDNARLLEESGVAGLLKSARKPELASTSDEQLEKAAKTKDGDAAFELGARRLLVRVQDEEAKRLLQLSGLKGNTDAFRILLKIEELKPVSRRDLRSQERWLIQLINSGDVGSQTELSHVSPAAYWSNAALFTSKVSLEKTDPKYLPIKFDSTIESSDKKTVLHPCGYQARDRITVNAEFSRTNGITLTKGRFVSVAGYLDDKNVFQVLMANMPEPSYVYSARLVKHAAVAGRQQGWNIQLSVRNTGRQPLRNIKFGVRCFQRASPNDYSKDAVVPALAPGDTANITVDFSMFNFQFIGATSIPLIGVQKRDFEW